MIKVFSAGLHAHTHSHKTMKFKNCSTITILFSLINIKQHYEFIKTSTIFDKYQLAIYIVKIIIYKMRNSDFRQIINIEINVT